MQITKSYLEIYSDGACRGNPGRGGYGTVVNEYRLEKVNGMWVRKPVKSEEFCEGFSYTTNNRMELMGFIEGIRHITPTHNIVDMYTDSSLICSAINKNWLWAWVNNGWKTKNKEPVKNDDLWKMLLSYYIPCKSKITVKWVKGHANNPLNCRCDWLATHAADNIPMYKKNGVYIQGNPPKDDLPVSIQNNIASDIKIN